MTRVIVPQKGGIHSFLERNKMSEAANSSKKTFSLGQSKLQYLVILTPGLMMRRTLYCHSGPEFTP